MKIIIDFDYETDGERLTEEEIYLLIRDYISINQEIPRIIDIDTSVIIINSFTISQ